ncbi:MAG: fibrobacter succinogenes major paralogous domain-containing protein [Saprospiraceae bacterium]|nr:fibrobacter succinogenes major paralogous domain-containing protein [Saprospiraceae bacterium]
MKNKYWLIQLFLTGVLLALTNSCIKDEATTSTKKNPIITWSNPADISFGTLLTVSQLNAKANVPGIFVYTPTFGTRLNAGANQNLKVEFTPTDVANYNVVSFTVKINVTQFTKTDPLIIWSNPADIIVGTILSASQLNATANVPGTFIYTPPIGTILNLGTNQDLKVDFTPNDVATYNLGSKTVKINVISAPGSGGTSSVIFNPNKSYGTMTDIDGNTYKTITIGTQTWMAENLRVTKYRNGDPITIVTDNANWTAFTSGAYCNYNNTTDKDHIATYGRLYNWYAVTDNRNIAPAGWHVPSDAEWRILTSYLGFLPVAGGKMKEISTIHWKSPNTGATNESGFSATPTGYRYGVDGVFYNLGELVGYWSNTPNGSSNAWGRFMGNFITECSSLNGRNNDGNAVRLVKD